jgi:hypothetical protein
VRRILRRLEPQSLFSQRFRQVFVSRPDRLKEKDVIQWILAAWIFDLHADRLTWAPKLNGLRQLGKHRWIAEGRVAVDMHGGNDCHNQDCGGEIASKCHGISLPRLEAETDN